MPIKRHFQIESESGYTYGSDSLESQASCIVWDQMGENYYRDPKTGKYYTLVSRLIPVTAKEVRYNIRENHRWFNKKGE